MTFEQKWFLSDNLISLNNNILKKKISRWQRFFTDSKNGTDCPKSVQKQLQIFSRMFKFVCNVESVDFFENFFHSRYIDLHISKNIFFLKFEV